jgi:hypothetical protein
MSYNDHPFFKAKFYSQALLYGVISPPIFMHVYHAFDIEVK